MKMIKESLGIEGDLDEKTAKQIIQSLDDDIQKAKEEQEQKEREAQAEENRQWSKRVAKARTSRANVIQRRKKEQQLKGYSAGRLARLRQLGKIDN
ncbi:hypothetical protein N9C99_00970 [Gammaproteobacteria bacterium]|nr:hypothetical protein [Gammaproteobacteria bacterium]